MRFGVCAPPDALESVAAAGFEYLEPSVAGMLQPEHPGTEIMPPLLAQFGVSRLKPETYNLLLPGDLKVVGPDADSGRQERYLEAAFRRAGQLGGKIAVFGSGGARRVPAGWPREEAHAQILAFLTRCGNASERHGMSVAIEPLNLSECNILNSVAEALSFVVELGHPAVGVLSDLYHVTHDGQSYSETRDAGPFLRHVHIAGLGRRAPIFDDTDYLREYFTVLKGAGYNGRISIECGWDNLAVQAAEARQVVGRAWEAA
jgi:sugar phosphate isomerase/epimerase